jgi:aspartate/methionine/tyrosine aminotransferase
VPTPLPALSRSAEAIVASVFAELAPHIEARARRGEDLVELHLGDSHRTPPEAARFARLEGEARDPGLYRYGAIAGLDALKHAFAERLRVLGFGPASIDPRSQVLVACGATHALFCAARAVLDPGDEVLVAAPYWPLAVGVIRAAGGVAIEVPVTTRLYAEASADAGSLFEAAVTPRTRAIYFITPNNPDGKVYGPRDLEGIARVARDRGLWVFADEVYADYVYSGAHASIARLEGMEDRTLSVYSLSKSHALAGARVGFLVAPARAVSLARRIATHTVFNVPVAAQRVALAALDDPGAWVDAARTDFRAARDATLRALEGSGVTALAPDGGSYVFIDFARVLDRRSLVTLLGRAIERGVLLAPGPGFGEAFGTWARLCFTSVPVDRLLAGVSRLRAAIEDVAPQGSGPRGAGA